MAQCTCEVRGQRVGVSSLLPPFRFQEWNAGLRTWQQKHLPTESSLQLDENSACNSACVSVAIFQGEIHSNGIFREREKTIHCEVSWVLPVCCNNLHSIHGTGGDCCLILSSS